MKFIQHVRKNFNFMPSSVSVQSLAIYVHTQGSLQISLHSNSTKSGCTQISSIFVHIVQWFSIGRIISTDTWSHYIDHLSHGILIQVDFDSSLRILFLSLKNMNEIFTKKAFGTCKPLITNIICPVLGSKVFGCKICCKSYSRRENLRRHIREQHEKKFFECTLCEFAAKRSVGLITHIKKYHS